MFLLSNDCVSYDDEGPRQMAQDHLSTLQKAERGDKAEKGRCRFVRQTFLRTFALGMHVLNFFRQTSETSRSHVFLALFFHSINRYV